MLISCGCDLGFGCGLILGLFVFKTSLLWFSGGVECCVL